MNNLRSIIKLCPYLNLKMKYRVMRIVLLTLLPLFFANLSFSQGAKVYLEGEQNTISTEISALEKRKTELTAAKREFITAKDLRGEYYDLSLKAMETGDAAYVDKAIQKLKDSKELLEKSFAKWNAYHTENRIPKSPLDEADYNNLLHTISNLLTEEKITAQKTGCCGPDIVEIHLVPQNVIEPANIDTGKNDFWVTGATMEPKQKEISSNNLVVTISDKQIDVGQFKYVAATNGLITLIGLASAQTTNNQLIQICRRGPRKYTGGDEYEIIDNVDLVNFPKTNCGQIFVNTIESSDPNYSYIEYAETISGLVLSRRPVEEYVEEQILYYGANGVYGGYDSNGNVIFVSWDANLLREINHLYNVLKNDKRGLAYQEYFTSSYLENSRGKYEEHGYIIEEYKEHIIAAYYLNLTFDFYKAFATIKRK